MKIKLIKSRWRQRYHFVIVANNGEIVATSENYANKTDAVVIMKKLKDELCNANLYDDRGLGIR